MREELFQEAFRKYGTPLYVFDLDILKEQTERIRAGFGPEINLCYAMKANPFLTGYMVRPNRGLLYGRIPNLQETASSTGKVVYFRCYEKTR